MFKSSENLRLAAEMRALERVAAPWRSARRTWFDGTPESLEARIAATERVLHHAQSGLTAAHLALGKEAEFARRELIEARHRLLTDFLDDGARAFKGSKRVAGPEGFADWDRGAWSTPSLMSGPPSREEVEEAHRKADPWGDKSQEDPYWTCPNCEAEGLDASDQMNSVHNDPVCPNCGTPQDQRTASKRVAGNGPGGIDDMMFPRDRQPTGADYLAEMEPEDRPGYGEGGSGRCKHCEETITEKGTGYAHYDGHNRIGEPHYYESDHPAEPEDDDDYGHLGFRRTATTLEDSLRGLRAEQEDEGPLHGEPEYNFRQSVPDADCKHCGQPLETRHLRDYDTGAITDSYFQHVNNDGQNLANPDGKWVDEDHEPEPTDEYYGPEPEKCQHGMSAWLCAGPEHYPRDDDHRWASLREAAAEDEACEDCGAEAGEKCRPWCCGKAKHDDEKAEKTSMRVAAINFLADQNTADRQELLFRAHRHAAERTGQLPVPTAQRVVQAFVAAVSREIPRTRPAARKAAAAPVVADFDDQLLFDS